MDVGLFNPYVVATPARVSVIGIGDLQLLLLLSALLTGLTSLVAGERLVDARQVERSANAAAVAIDATAAAVPIASKAIMRAATPVSDPVAVRTPSTVLIEQAPNSLAPVDERRLE